jgi:subtilisin
MGLALSLAAAIILSPATVAQGAADGPSQAGGASPYIVVLRDGVSARSVANEHAAAHNFTPDFVYEHALRGYAGRLSAPALARIKSDPRVLFVSEDRPVHASAQSVPTGIGRIQSDVSTQISGNGGGSVTGVAVAVIDTGSGPHPDLNVVGGKNCSTGNSYNDGNGHGSHVAGTIGAKDNGDGVVGVAPSVPIYSVRVLNNAGSGSWSSVACGIDWVTANAAAKNIKVANMSLGGGGSDDGNCGNSNKDALHKSICSSVAAGVTYVVAAGNEGTDFRSSVPAAYDEVLTVTAAADFNGQPGGGAAATCRSDVDETAADFSNFTSASTDAQHTIAAPGVCIRSTWKSNGYNTISGTSMATPHVAGAAALCLSNGKCSGVPSAVISKLRGDAAAQPASYGFAGDPNAPSGDRYYGYLLYAGGY